MMKKYSIIIGVFALLAFASCKKSRTCECISYRNGEELPKINNTSTIDGLTKKDAIIECNKLDSAVTVIVDGEFTTEPVLTKDHYSTNCELN